MACVVGPPVCGDGGGGGRGSVPSAAPRQRLQEKRARQRLHGSDKEEHWNERELLSLHRDEDGLVQNRQRDGDLHRASGRREAGAAHDDDPTPLCDVIQGGPGDGVRLLSWLLREQL